MKQTKIICGFPGVGKSHLYRNQMKYGLKILDSDSSTFDKTEFPDNYIKHIKENIGKADVILVSSHKEVRDALVAEKLPHYFVHPCISMNMVYKKRYEDRGSDEKFINLIMNNWDIWIREILDEEPSIYRTNIKIGYDTMTNVVTSLFNIETPNDIERKNRMCEDHIGKHGFESALKVCNEVELLELLKKSVYDLNLTLHEVNNRGMFVTVAQTTKHSERPEYRHGITEIRNIELVSLDKNLYIKSPLNKSNEKQ